MLENIEKWYWKLIASIDVGKWWEIIACIDVEFILYWRMLGNN